MIAKSMIAQCRIQVGIVKEAAEKQTGEVKFEGVMWHGGYDQSITSSAARAPHTAPILPDHYLSSATPLPRQRRQRKREENRGVA